MTTRSRDGARPRPRREPDRPMPPFVYVFAAVAAAPSPASLRRLPTMPGGEPPRVLSVVRGVSLIVADVPQATYAPDVLEPRLADADWVSSAAASHHAVIERLARSHSLLPFRIFTIFSGDARARVTTGATAAKLRLALRRLEGAEEWVLRIGPPNPARAASPPAAASGPSDASGTSFLQRKAAAVREQRAQADRIKAGTARLVSTLEPLADRTSVRAGPEGTSLLVDAAFLVQKRRRAAFRRALTAGATPLLTAGCAVSLTGPWPPYSFSSID